MPASLSFLYTMPLPMNQLKIKNKYGNHGIKHYIKYFIFYSSPYPIFFKMEYSIERKSSLQNPNSCRSE